jgi:signal transduction histidine kinase
VCWLAKSDARSTPLHESVIDDEADPQLEIERNRVVVQLAGAVAHKLKQPLAVAWGYLELLLDDPNCDLAPSTVGYLREIEASLHSMDETINKLQEATTYRSRPYAGSLEILDLG